MASRQCSEDAIVQMLDECDLSDLEDVLSESSVEINKHKIFDANNAWITELYEFTELYVVSENQKHNLSNLPHQTVKKLEKKTMGSSEDPSLVNNVDELGFVY